MAVLSIFADNASEENYTEVLALNESHFIFDTQISYVNLEFFVYLKRKTSKIKILLHGNVLNNDDVEKLNISNHHYFNKYIIEPSINKYSDIDKNVHNYSKTFFDKKLKTNNVYEPPQEEIESDEASSTIKIYKIKASIPGKNTTITIEPDKKISVINLVKTKNHFNEDEVYGFRLGFWILFDQINDKKKKIKLLEKWCEKKFYYDVHYYGLSSKEEKLKEKCLKYDKCMYSRLWGKIDCENGLKKLIEHFQQKSDEEIEEFYNNNELTRPHTDIFVLLPQKWEVEGDMPLSYKMKKPTYILYMKEQEGKKEKKELPFSQHHKYLCEKMLPYAYTNTTLFPEDKNKITAFSIKIINQPIQKIIRHMIVFLIFPIFLWTLYFNFKNVLFSKSLLDFETKNIQCFTGLKLFCYGIYLYLFMLTLDVVFWHRDTFLHFFFYIYNGEFCRKRWFRIVTANVLTIAFVLVTTEKFYSDIKNQNKTIAVVVAIFIINLLLKFWPKIKKTLTKVYG